MPNLYEISERSGKSIDIITSVLAAANTLSLDVPISVSIGRET
jgi:hypothetical protein